METEEQIRMILAELYDDVIEAIQVYEIAHLVDRDRLLELAAIARAGRADLPGQARAQVIDDPESTFANRLRCNDCHRIAAQEGKDAHGQSIGSQVFPSRSSHDNARSSPARTRSSIRRCGSRNVCGTNTGDCGFGVPATVKSCTSGGTGSMSDFLFILVDLTEYIVEILCASVGFHLRLQNHPGVLS